MKAPRLSGDALCVSIVQRTAFRWKTLSYVWEMESGDIIAVPIWTPMSSAAPRAPSPAASTMERLWGSASGSGDFRLTAFRIAHATAETASTPARNVAGPHGIPMKG